VKKILCGLLFIGLVFILFVIFFKHKGVDVIIANQSKEDVSSLRISFTGGSAHIPLLHVGETKSSLINPTSESHVEIDYQTQSGATRHARIDTYIMVNTSGHIYVTLMDTEIKWVDKAYSSSNNTKSITFK
jgi:hypothetical protein